MAYERSPWSDSSISHHDRKEFNLVLGNTHSVNFVGVHSSLALRFRYL